MRGLLVRVARVLHLLRGARGSNQLTLLFASSSDLRVSSPIVADAVYGYCGLTGARKGRSRRDYRLAPGPAKVAGRPLSSLFASGSVTTTSVT